MELVVGGTWFVFGPSLLCHLGLHVRHPVPGIPWGGFFSAKPGGKRRGVFTEVIFGSGIGSLDGCGRRTGARRGRNGIHVHIVKGWVSLGRHAGRDTEIVHLILFLAGEDSGLLVRPDLAMLFQLLQILLGRPMLARALGKAALACDDFGLRIEDGLFMLALLVAQEANLLFLLFEALEGNVAALDPLETPFFFFDPPYPETLASVARLLDPSTGGGEIVPRLRDGALGGVLADPADGDEILQGVAHLAH